MECFGLVITLKPLKLQTLMWQFPTVSDMTIHENKNIMKDTTAKGSAYQVYRNINAVVSLKY